MKQSCDVTVDIEVNGSTKALHKKCSPSIDNHLLALNLVN